MEFSGVGLPNIVVELEAPGSNDGWKFATMTGIIPRELLYVTSHYEIITH